MSAGMGVSSGATRLGCGLFTVADRAELMRLIEADAEQRFVSMARWLAGLPSDAERREHLTNIQRHQGSEFHRRLRAAVWRELQSRSSAAVGC